MNVTIYSNHFLEIYITGNCKFCAAEAARKRQAKSLIDVNSNFLEYEFLEYTNNKTPSQVKHKNCGKIFTVTPTNLRGGQRCPYCYSSSSVIEKEFFSKIQEIFPNTKKEKLYINKKEHKFYEIDIYVPELKLGIELDGLYWHSEFCGKDKNYHLDKTNFCNKKGIHLIHIFEDEYKNNKDIILDKISSYTNSIKNKIYARKCSIKEIDSKERNDFLNENHIQGADKANISLGLFYEDNLVAVMSFTKLRKALGQNSQEYIFELSRYCGKLNTTIVGGFSKLFSYALKNYDIKKVITYADLRFTKKDSNVYLKNNFILDHISKPSYFYIDKNSKTRYHRFNYRKQKLKELFPSIYSDDKSEFEIMSEAGYARIWDCGNLVYTYDNPYFKKA